MMSTGGNGAIQTMPTPAMQPQIHGQRVVQSMLGMSFSFLVRFLNLSTTII